MDMHDGKAPFCLPYRRMGKLCSGKKVFRNISYGDEAYKQISFYVKSKYGNDSARSKNTLSLEGGPSRC